MTKESINHQYVSYPMFKGLQKPLEFMGFQGRYITWAAATVGGGILSFIIVYCILGFVAGLTILAVTLCTGAALIFFKQRKGLHTKKEEHGVFITENRPLARGLYEAVDLDQEIPDRFYQPVAEVLAFVYSLKKKELK